MYVGVFGRTGLTGGKVFMDELYAADRIKIFI